MSKLRVLTNQFEFTEVLTYIVVSATDSGIDESFSFYLLSIANASSTLGRFVGGFSTDKFGEPRGHGLFSSTMKLIALKVLLIR